MLVIEALQALPMKAKDIGMISSFEVSADKLVVTHFQYAGDTHFQKKKKNMQARPSHSVLRKVKRLQH